MREILGGVAVVMLVAATAPSLASGFDPHVHVEGFAFSPTPLAMRLGETVTWDNHDLITHTIVSDAPLFTSPQLQNGHTFSFTPALDGAIAYHCAQHLFMRAELQVFDPLTLPDLVIGAIDVVAEIPGVSQTIRVTVRNIGASEADASDARLWYRLDGEQHLIGAFAVPVLAADAEHSEDLVWDTLGFVGDFPLDALSDVEDDVFEGFEANNAAAAQTTVILEGFEGRDLLAELGL